MTRAYSAAFKAGLASFPKTFRDTFAEEMVSVFEERCVERSVGNRALFTVREIGAAFIAGMRLRVSSTPMRSPLLTTSMLVAACVTMLAVHDSPPARDFRIDFSGHDPAGSFTIAVVNGKAVSATLDNSIVSPSRILQRRDSIRILGPKGDVALAVLFDSRDNGISWEPRK